MEQKGQEKTSDRAATVGDVERIVSKAIGDFAIVVAEGFLGVNRRFDGVEQRLDSLEARTERLERGQDEILLRLSNVSYRFEYQELDQRVTRLERKAKPV